MKETKETTSPRGSEGQHRHRKGLKPGEIGGGRSGTWGYAGWGYSGLRRQAWLMEERNLANSEGVGLTGPC